MSIKEEIDRDLREYLNKADNMRNQDRLTYLTTIFNKHLELNKLDHIVNANDIFMILSDAKSEFTRIPGNPHISQKAVNRGDFVGISVIEAYTTYLNRNDLLKRMPMVDYTDDSNDYDTFD